MTLLGITTLAMSIGDLLQILFFMVIFIGPWIVKQIAAHQARMKKQQQELEARMESGAAPPGLPMAEGQKASMAEAAARRREKLARREQVEAKAASAEPTNMTMAERIERARAKQQYEARAEAIRRGEQVSDRPIAQQPTQPPVQPPVQPPARRPAQAPARQPAGRPPKTRQEADRIAIASAKHRREEAARRAVAEHQRKKQAEADARKQDAVNLRASMDAPVSSLVTPTPATLSNMATEHTASTAAGALAPGVVKRSSLILGHSLRDAMILKEILDPPVGLRQDVSR